MTLSPSSTIPTGPSLASVKRAFEQPQWYLSGTGFNIRIRAETVKELVQGRPCDSILDIGCGDGSISRPLLRRETELTLLDQSAAMLNIAASRTPDENKSSLRVINKDFMHADLRPGSFDIVLCVGVMAYVEDRKAFLARIKALLRPGGTLVLECTDGPHIVSRWARAYRRLASFRKPTRVQTVVGGASALISMSEELGFRLKGGFRYSMPISPFSRLMSHRASYRFVRVLFGAAGRNRLSALGNECLFCFHLD